MMSSRTWISAVGYRVSLSIIKKMRAYSIKTTRQFLILVLLMLLMLLMERRGSCRVAAGGDNGKRIIGCLSGGRSSCVVPEQSDRLGRFVGNVPRICHLSPGRMYVCVCVCVSPGSLVIWGG
jgi:hypothetical protein